MSVAPGLSVAVVLAYTSVSGACSAAKNSTWPCYWIHGRMWEGNGTPSTRIWRAGTHRLLGVVNPGPGGAEEDVGQPDSLPNSPEAAERERETSDCLG